MSNDSTAAATVLQITDGGISAEHPKRRLPVVVAPTTTADKVNTIRPGIRTIACWRLDDPRFGFDASFIEDTAIEEFKTLAALTSAHEDAPLSVFAHADVTGDDDYNKVLAGRRAESVYAVLTRRADMWEALFKEPHGHDRWGTKHVQQMLITVGFFDGPASDVLTSAAREAVRSYQTARGLAVDGVAGPATREKLIPEYMDAICPFTLEKERFLGRGADPKGKADYQGCGEFNPAVVFSEGEQQEFQKAENKPVRDEANAPNRRILVYLFDPDIVMSPEKWPCPRSREGTGGCKTRFWSDADVRRTAGETQRRFESDRNTFACRFYHGLAMRSVCEARQFTRVTVALRNRMGDLLKNAPFRMRAGSQQRVGRAANGLATIIVPGLPDRCSLEWGVPEDKDIQTAQTPPRYTIDLHVQPEIGTNEEQAKKRLHNIGYSDDLAFEEAIAAFQLDHELPFTDGKLDDRTRDALTSAHGTLATTAAEPEEKKDNG